MTLIINVQIQLFSQNRFFQQKNKVIDKKGASIDVEQEGSVVYITKNNRVLSLCKTKSFEYRIYRKLREKLKTLAQTHYQNKEFRWKKMVHETKDLIGNNMTLKKLDYYFKVARVAFDYASLYQISGETISSNYIEFLTIVIASIYLSEEPTPYLLNEMPELKKQQWDQFYVEQIQINEQFLDTSNFKSIHVLIPVSIPGMGKTYLKKILQENLDLNDIEFSYVSSDEIRGQCISQIKKQKSNITDDQAFQMTSKKGIQEYHNRLEKIIQGFQYSKKSKMVLFLDKNHPPSAIQSTIEGLATKCPETITIRTVAVVPEMVNALYANQRGEFPFSIYFILNCLQRVQLRIDHETLKGNGEQSANIVFMFIQLFQNFSYDEKSLQNKGFDHVIQVPFIQEKSEERFSQELIKQFHEIMCNFDSKNLNNNLKSIRTFLQLFKNEQFDIDLQKSELDLKNFAKNLNWILDNFQISSDLSYQEKSYKKEEISMEIENKNKMHQQQKSIDKPQKYVKLNKFEYTEKTPIFTAVFVNPNDLKFTLKQYILKHIQNLCVQYPKCIEIKNDIENFEQIFKFPNTFHVTLLYIGSQKHLLNTPMYTSFKEKQQVDISLTALVYVPNKIITAVCSLNPLLQSQNRHPHMTLMTGEWKPMESNALLDEIFDKNIKKDQYDQMYYEMNIRNYIPAFLIPIQNYNVRAITDFFFGNNYLIQN